MNASPKNTGPKAGASSEDELSMEEILSSIRRIISEENPQDANAETPQGSDTPEDMSASQDTSAMSDAARDNAPPAAPSPALPGSGEEGLTSGGTSAETTSREEVLLLTQLVNDEGKVIDLSRQVGSTGLMSVQAIEQSSQAFAALADALVRENVNRRRTLEDLIQDIMRPLLKEWLDNNLSAMVERIIRSEIERIANRTTTQT